MRGAFKEKGDVSAAVTCWDIAWGAEFVMSIYVKVFSFSKYFMDGFFGLWASTELLPWGDFSMYESSWWLSIIVKSASNVPAIWKIQSRCDHQKAFGEFPGPALQIWDRDVNWQADIPETLE